MRQYFTFVYIVCLLLSSVSGTFVCVENVTSFRNFQGHFVKKVGTSLLGSIINEQESVGGANR